MIMVFTLVLYLYFEAQSHSFLKNKNLLDNELGCWQIVSGKKCNCENKNRNLKHSENCYRGNTGVCWGGGNALCFKSWCCYLGIVSV